MRIKTQGRARDWQAALLWLAASIVSFAVVPGLAQQPNVPKSVQADLLKQDIAALLGRDKVTEALAKFDELHALEPNLPPAYLYLEAKAADFAGRPNRALRVLEEYFAKASREDAAYPKALALMRAVQPKAKAAAGKEVAAEIQMVAIPGGSFEMGDSAGDGEADERPVHSVTVKPFKLGKYEVTVGQFRAFVTATDYRTEAERNVGEGGCQALDLATGKYAFNAGTSWNAPGFPQAGIHPVVCVSWNDAQAFIEWLNRESGRRFRLPSEAEWEYAARAGATTRYPWGSNADEGCRYANGADQTPWPDGAKFEFTTKMECNDGFLYSAPVGSYAANPFGLHDLIGNVWEWTGDCWNESYAGAPTDGSAWRTGDCSGRVIRGGSWNTNPTFLRVSNHSGVGSTLRDGVLGFRLAQDM